MGKPSLDLASAARRFAMDREGASSKSTSAVAADASSLELLAERPLCASAPDRDPERLMMLQEDRHDRKCPAPRCLADLNSTPAKPGRGSDQVWPLQVCLVIAVPADVLELTFGVTREKPTISSAPKANSDVATGKQTWDCGIVESSAPRACG